MDRSSVILLVLGVSIQDPPFLLPSLPLLRRTTEGVFQRLLLGIPLAFPAELQRRHELGTQALGQALPQLGGGAPHGLVRLGFPSVPAGPTDVRFLEVGRHAHFQDGEPCVVQQTFLDLHVVHQALAQLDVHAGGEAQLLPRQFLPFEGRDALPRHPIDRHPLVVDATAVLLPSSKRPPPRRRARLRRRTRGGSLPSRFPAPPRAHRRPRGRPHPAWEPFGTPNRRPGPSRRSKKRKKDATDDARWRRSKGTPSHGKWTPLGSLEGGRDRRGVQLPRVFEGMGDGQARVEDAKRRIDR
eukprot:scaffold363_cov331-Pavlova_lutheri.AAC.101